MSESRRPLRFQLERVAGVRLEGWAFDPVAPGLESLQLSCDGKALPIEVRRVDREDVAAACGVNVLALGWIIQLPPEIWRLAVGGAPTLTLHVNGQEAKRFAWKVEAAALPAWIAGDLITLDEADRVLMRPLFEAHLCDADRLRLAQRNAAALPSPPAGRLEGLRGQHVVGWVVDGPTSRHRFELRLPDGSVLPCPVSRVSRQDVAQQILWSDEHLGFDIEIPGGAWRQVPAGADFRCQVLVDGKPWGAELVLRRDGLIGSLEESSAHVDGRMRVHSGLLAIEHVVHAGLWDTMTVAQRVFARGLAEAAGQGEWLHAVLGEVQASVSLVVKVGSPRGRLGRLLQRRPFAWAALAWLSWLRKRPHHQGQADRTEVVLTSALGLFDADLYAVQVPAAKRAGLSALMHYVVEGDARSLVPHPLFDPRHYTGQLPGRCHPGINRLLHYGLEGRFLGRATCAWFNSGHYLQQGRDVRKSGIEPLRHFVRWGWQDQRSVCEGFLPNSVQGQPLLARLTRMTSPLRQDPVLRYLMDGLPATAPLPEHGHLPWRVPTELEGRDHLELDAWRAFQPPRRDGPVVDVIIPIYAGAQESLRCVWSALTAPGRQAFELVVIDDASPEPALSRMLEQLAELKLIRLLVNEHNLGFVRSVNRGMSEHPERDVVLLNADAKVHGDWLDRLTAHARRHPRAASITPISNNATIFSYPRTLHNNSDASSLRGEDLDRLAASANAGRSVEVPTGMGFCMYMRRSCMTQIGLFDAERYGRGYGEENDWCRRAAAAGWRHLAAPDVFVMHQGSVSFKAEADERAGAALALLLKRFPDYQRQIDDWIKVDALAPLRARLDLARLVESLDGQPVVLMISHDRGGGTAKHEAEVAERLRAGGREVLLLRPSPEPDHVMLQAPWIGEFPNLALLPLAPVQGWEDDFELSRLLASLPIESVQLHHLADFSPGLRRLLPAMCQRLGVPLEVTLHDYHLLCPRINLVDASGLYCGEPAEAGCMQCLGTDARGREAGPITLWRREHGAVLAAASRIVAPDSDVLHRFARYFPAVSMEVVPHEARLVPDRDRWNAQAEIRRVLVVGALSRIKGLEVVRELALESGRRGGGLQLTLLGHSSDDAGLAAAGVRVLGYYDDEHVLARIAEQDPDLILLPSVWPETYCYVLSAALRSGRPTAVFDIGAQARRLRELELTEWILPLALAHDPARLFERLRRATVDQS